MRRVKQKSSKKPAKKASKATVLHSDTRMSGGDTYTQNILAQFSARPDLLVEAVERDDPGAVTRINKQFRQQSQDIHTRRLRFVQFQAYWMLFLGTILVIPLTILFGFLAYNGLLFWSGFWLVILIALFMSGPAGFIGILYLIKGERNKKSDDN